MTQDAAIARLTELITAGEGGHATHAIADAYDRLNLELPFWYS